MAKLNTDVSIVDYLESQGQDSSYAERKKLAEKNGIKNYSGTASQNTQLLGILKKSGLNTMAGTAVSAGLATAGVKPTKKKTSASEKTNVNSNAGSSTSVDTPVTPTTTTTAPTTPTAQATETLPTYQRLQAVAPTFNYDVQAPTYKGSYNDQINQLMASILNQGSFSYNKDTDPLYQQYAKSYQHQSDLAMRNTMANASALTGGYGSSYASTAGQQAYNEQMSGLDDVAMNLYDRAYTQYQDGLNAKYNQLNTLQNAADSEYNKYVDSYNQWAGNRDTEYNHYLNNLDQFNYENEQDYKKAYDNRQWNYDVERDNIQDGQWQQEQDYLKSRADIQDSQWQQDFDYQKNQDAIRNDYNRQQLAISAAKNSNSSSSDSENKDVFAKGTKAYAERKNYISERVEEKINAVDAMGNKVNSKMAIEDYIFSMSENTDMAQELLQAYGLYDDWYNNEKLKESDGYNSIMSAIGTIGRTMF